MSNFISVDMRNLSCSCGCVFSVPDFLFLARVAVEECVHCPGCAKELFFEPDKPKVLIVPIEERQKLIRAMHDAEQAEARAAEGKPPAPESPPAYTVQGRSIVCHCKKRYVYLRSFQDHVRHCHGVVLTREQVSEIVGITAASKAA